MRKPTLVSSLLLIAAAATPLAAASFHDASVHGGGHMNGWHPWNDEQEPSRHEDHDADDVRIRHVLLLSIDGLHQIDVDRFITKAPTSTLASLAKMGVVYSHATSSNPSDSFPGLLALVTGGTPKSTGVFYDNSYDRTLFAPGSDVHTATPGTEVVFDEGIEFDSNKLDGGGGIDPSKLPLDAHGHPVYPHSLLRTNTIFEVIRAAGGLTAWADKHFAYDLVNGPSGHGVVDLFTPEIAADGDYTRSIPTTETYDDLKVAAILHQIDGFDHTGAHAAGVPMIFGMNFQAVSVGEKVIVGGYRSDVIGQPTANLQDALNHTDASIGLIVAELKKQHLLESTLILVTAKHGQCPIDPTKTHKIDPALLEGVINSERFAKVTEDDVALVWLKKSSDTAQVVHDLQAKATDLGIDKILWGAALAKRFGDPTHNSRTPDIIILPVPGVIYTHSSKKNAEHGGFSEDDTHVGLIVANPRLHPHVIAAPVQTTQVAPTILWSLGLNPEHLKSVREEGTRVLPGL